MVGRHSHPPNSNNSTNSNNSNGSISTRRKSRGVEEEKEKRENRRRTASTQPEEGSDGDALVESESERAEMDTIVKVEPVAAPIKRKRGRPRGSGRKFGNQSVQEHSRPTSQSARKSHERQSPMIPLPHSPRALDTPSPTFAAASPKSHMPTSESSKERKTPQVQKSKIGAGGSVPYYYEYPNIARAASGQSSGNGISKKSLASTISNQKPDAGAGTATGSKHDSSMEGGLTIEECDKFLDLIEKHNLQTSNEDDMARSLTEIYQEWLEWCAKRNVQSTKSKEALIREFPRIHQGKYGSAREKRAKEIVEGSAGGSALEGGVDGNHALVKELAKEAESSRRSIPPLPVGTTSKHEVVERDVPPSIAVPVPAESSRPALHSDSGAPSQYIHVQSPAVPPKALTPEPTRSEPYNLQVYPPAHMDIMHHQIREEIWRDANGMIHQVISEQMGELMAENASLRARVDLLEIHSDNLAQWIQHLNRVQDDLSATIHTPAPPAPPPRDMIHHMDDPALKYGHPANHPNRDRMYAPPYNQSPRSSPKRNYAVRRSPSPVMIHHTSSSSSAIPPSTRRPGIPPQSPTAPTAPNTRQYHPPPPTTTAYRDHPQHIREHSSREHPYSSNRGGHRIVSSDQYERPYYTYPPDDREPPISTSPHQAKRARNGY